MTDCQFVTRRQALRWSAASLLSLGLWPGRAEAPAESSGWFRFLVVNDLHYMSPECGAWLETVVARMREHAGVEFCLVAGDLTEHGRREDLATVRDILSQLKFPVYVQPGNHDYETERDRSAYDELFPNQLNYAFNAQGWQFVGIDSTDGQKYQNTQIHPSAFSWLDDQLPRLNRHRPTVLFTHFPLGEAVTYRPQNADALLERFIDFNLQAVYSGHFHGFTQRDFHGSDLTTNKCCALKRANHDHTPEKGYFLCTADHGKITRTFIQMNK